MARREFSQRTKLKAFDRACGKCERCGIKLLPATGIEYDHIVPDALTGLNDLENCRVLCSGCHKDKTRNDVRQIRKADRQRAKHVGAGQSRWPKSRFKRKMDGTVVDRETGEPV